MPLVNKGADFGRGLPVDRTKRVESPERVARSRKHDDRRLRSSRDLPFRNESPLLILFAPHFIQVGFELAAFERCRVSVRVKFIVDRKECAQSALCMGRGAEVPCSPAVEIAKLGDAEFKRSS